MLGVSGSAHKFPPYVIFKGKPGARIKKELRKWEDNGYFHGCFYGVQLKAWMNEEVMLKWIERVWKPFTASKNGLTMLIIDQMKAHLLPTVKRAIENCGTILEFIPAGFTSRLQVCNIGLNKPFKDYIRATVHEWLVIRKQSVAKPDRPTVSHWIHHAWTSITTRTIINTWAHIHLVDRAEENTDQGQEAMDEESLMGFLSDDDAREHDILALRESDEISDEEED